MTGKALEELHALGIYPDTVTSAEIFKVHMLNIGVAAVMLLIGTLLLFITRKETDSGKKIAGWILIGLGFTVAAVHIIQMVV